MQPLKQLKQLKHNCNLYKCQQKNDAIVQCSPRQVRFRWNQGISKTIDSCRLGGAQQNPTCQSAYLTDLQEMNSVL